MLIPPIAEAMAGTGDNTTVALIATDEEDRGMGSLVGAVESLLCDLDVTLTVEWVESIPADMTEAVRIAKESSRKNNAKVVFWSDPDVGKQIFFYIATQDQKRILVRQLDIDQDGDRFESLAVIVHSVVDAVLRGGRVGVEIDKTTLQNTTSANQQIAAEKQIPPIGDEKEEKKKNSDFRLAVRTSYSLQTYSSKKLFINGFGLDLALASRNGIIAFIGYIFRPPLSIESGETAFRVGTHPIYVGFGYDWRFGRWSIGGAIRLVGDLFTQKTTRAASDTATRLDNRDFVFSIAPTLSVEMDLVWFLSLFFHIGVQYDITSVEYVSKSSHEETTLDSPWRWRPLCQMGMAIYFWNFGSGKRADRHKINGWKTDVR